MDDLINNFDNLEMQDKSKEKSIITEFIDGITNKYQNDILSKLFNGSYGKMYLVKYKKNEKNQIVIDILGSRNKDYRSNYTVILHKEYYNFTCNCKDYIYRANVNNIVCKHITFILCKVACIFDYKYFISKRLSNCQLNAVINVIENDRIWNNTDISIKNINSNFEKNIRKLNKEDSCPICYDIFGDKELVSCPDCKGYIHKECMCIWLKTSKTCVCCRSNKFSNYIKDINLI